MLGPPLMQRQPGFQCLLPTSTWCVQATATANGWPARAAPLAASAWLSVTPGTCTAVLTGSAESATAAGASDQRVR